MSKVKMTKAEAFEYLKGKKVYVEEHTLKAQELLFKIGYSWWDFGTLTKRYDPESNYQSILMCADGTLRPTNSYDGAQYPGITLKDLLSIDIKDDDNDISIIVDELCQWIATNYQIYKYDEDKDTLYRILHDDLKRDFARYRAKQ